MEKFKTLNNSLCKDIFRNAVNGSIRAVYIRIFNCHDMMTDELFERVLNLVLEICPLSLEIYKSLPFDVQSYYNSLWLSR